MAYRAFYANNSEVCILRRICNLEVFAEQLFADRIFVIRHCRFLPMSQTCCNVTYRLPYFRSALHRQCVSVILQHDYGLELGLIACRHILMASHHGSSILRIDIWILKNTYTEYVGEKAYSGHFESLPRTLFSVLFFPQFICLQAYGIVRCASKLVNPGFEAFESFLGRGFCLHAPWSSTVFIDFIVIIDNTPVGADHSFIVILVAKEFLNDIVAESVADILSGRVLTVGNRVIRHHGRRHLRPVAEIECSIDKWNEILSKIVSRIDGIFSCAEMGVTAAFSSSSSRPVLDHAVD